MEQVPTHIVNKRVAELTEANKLKRLDYRERFKDKVLEGILTEENPHYSLVITKNYLSVRVPPARGFKKRKVKVRIDRILNENLCEGTIVN
jgi:tRNA A37 methylthiotransferase MiaB